MTEGNAETPTQTLAKTGKQVASHPDGRGRLITVSTLTALEYYRFTKAMGSSASNPATMDFAAIAATVRKIDAIDYTIPATERDVEFIIQQLDFDGIAAAGLALAKLNDSTGADGKDELDASKN